MVCHGAAECLGTPKLGKTHRSRMDDLVRRFLVEDEAELIGAVPQICARQHVQRGHLYLAGVELDEELEGREEVVQRVAGQADDQVALDGDALPLQRLDAGDEPLPVESAAACLERRGADRLRSGLDRHDPGARQQLGLVVVDPLDVHLDRVQPDPARRGVPALR